MFKSLLIALSLVATAAQAKTIARTTFAERTEANEFVLVNVELDDSGVLVLSRDTVERGRRDILGEGNIIRNDVQTVQLKKVVYNELKNAAVAVSNEELKVERRRVVCMMMPMPGADPVLFVAQNYNYDTQNFDGELRGVYENGACWKPVVTKLKLEYLNNVARTLLDHMIILGRQSID